MIRGKTRSSFEEAYQENLEMVRGLLYNMTGRSDLDDLTQEVFLKAWKSLPGFSFKSSLRTWLYRIAVHVAIDHLRRRKLTQPDADELVDPSTPEKDLGQSRERMILQEELMRLEDEERAMLILVYFEDRPLKEVASILSVPEGTVKSRLHTARTRLREALRKRGVDD